MKHLECGRILCVVFAAGRGWDSPTAGMGGSATLLRWACRGGPAEPTQSDADTVFSRSFLMFSSLMVTAPL